jgi:GNAT superfamily N-acetyltransferase
MEIAFFQDQHLDSVVDLFCDMSAHYNGSNASPAEAVRRNLVRNILGPDSGVKLVLAIENGRAIGVACISLLYPAPKEKCQLFMKELYVSSAYRNHGVGPLLMKFIAAYALTKECVRFDWTVDSDNSRAAEFYRRLGAEQLSTKLYFRLGTAQMEQLATKVVAENDG